MVFTMFLFENYAKLILTFSKLKRRMNMIIIHNLFCLKGLSATLKFITVKYLCFKQ